MNLSKRVTFLLFNFLGLQLTWAACAYGAINHWPLLGVYTGFGYLLLHFIIVQQRRRDLVVAAVVGGSGVILDSINYWMNVISFSSQTEPGFFIPFWLVTLWLVFSMTIPYSLYWLKNNMLVASLAGAVGGSASYYLGHLLGAITYVQSTWLSASIYFVEWGIFFPLALMIVTWLSRKNPQPSAA